MSLVNGACRLVPMMLFGDETEDGIGLLWRALVMKLVDVVVVGAVGSEVPSSMAFLLRI